MATRSLPEKRRFFIARSDWRDETQYPPADLLDPSVWAWELLRRSSEYARDYEICHEHCVDVPATPYPMDPLTNYICEPDADGPNMVYKDYAKRHRRHFVYPVKDAVRHKWQINEMPNPAHGWKQLLPQRQIETPNHNQLAWLFACNTVEVINPPDRWTIGTRVALPVHGICVDNEVLVRLNLTGNLDEQIESLRRQIAGFFTGGRRSGGVEAGEYMDVGGSQTVRYDPQRRTAIDTRSGLPQWPVLNNVAVRAQPSDWNKIPVRQKSLHYILRMADAIASAEQGTLADQIREPRIDVTHIGFTAQQIRVVAHSPSSERRLQMYEEFFPSMAKALARYFSLHPFPDDNRDVDYKTIHRWTSLGFNLIVKREHALIARMNTIKDKTRKQQGTTRK